MKPTLVVLVGLPGCGKTMTALTVVIQLNRQKENSAAWVLGDSFKGREAAEIDDRLRHHEVVITDRCHTRAEDRAYLKDVSVPHNLVFVKFCHVTDTATNFRNAQELCLKQIQKRKYHTSLKISNAEPVIGMFSKNLAWPMGDNVFSVEFGAPGDSQAFGMYPAIARRASKILTVLKRPVRGKEELGEPVKLAHLYESSLGAQRHDLSKEERARLYARYQEDDDEMERQKEETEDERLMNIARAVDKALISV